MQQVQPIILQVAFDYLHESGIVLRSHVFQNTDRDNAVKLLVDLTVVLEAQVDIEVFVALLPVLDLFF